MIILGIDPGLAIVGYGVIETQKSASRAIDCGVINTPKEDSVPIRLTKIYDGMISLIEKYQPDCIAIEELFFNTNITTGIKRSAGKRSNSSCVYSKEFENVRVYTLADKAGAYGIRKGGEKANSVYGNEVA